MLAVQDEPMVVRTLALVIVRQVLGLVGRGPSPDANDVEIAVLHHQLLVLRRQLPRPRCTPTDRMVLAALAKLLPRNRSPIFLVTPSTLLRWHRELIRRRWTYPTSGRSRRALNPEVVDLIVQLARESPLRIPAHRRRMPQARRAGVGDLGRRDPMPPRTGAGAPARRTDLDPIPARPGRWEARVRLSHGRNGRAAAAAETGNTASTCGGRRALPVLDGPVGHSVMPAGTQDIGHTGGDIAPQRSGRHRHGPVPAQVQPP